MGDVRAAWMSEFDAAAKTQNHVLIGILR